MLEKTPLRVRRLITRCSNGAKLCVMLPPDGGDRRYFLEPGGIPVGTRTAEDAIRLGLATAQNDGLFGETQTFVVSA